LGVAEGGGFAFAERTELAGAALDGGAGNLVRESRGSGAGTLGVRENVEIGEGQLFDEGERGGVVCLGFAGESGDDVGTDGGVREAFVDERDAAGVVFGAIPAVHGGEDAVGARLQRHVEVLGDAIVGDEKFDEVLGDVLRLDGADAEAFDRGFIEDAEEERFEFDTGGEIAAVGAEVDAAENDFAVAGLAEALDFGDDNGGREAAAFAADERDDAVRAAEITAVLNF